MKTRIFITLVLLLSVIGFTSAQQTKFFVKINSPAEGDSNLLGIALSNWFEVSLKNSLKKKYPCAATISNYDINNLLELERKKELLAADDGGETLGETGRSMGCDYLVAFNINIVGKNVFLNAFCAYLRNDKVISRVSEQCPDVYSSDKAVDIVERMADKVVEGLKTREICTYKGTVIITVKSHKENTEKDEYPVSCNGTEQVYKINSKSQTSETDNWNLTKTSKIEGSGTVKQEIYDELITEEENGCYACPSGREGGRTYYERAITTMDVEGLSQESVENGKHVDDSTIKLEFYPDSTYTIEIKATSQKGPVVVTKEEHAEGTCDIINNHTTKETSLYDAPLPLVLGPFKGNSLCKTLKEKNVEKTTDPETGEVKEITFEFELTRP